MSIKLIHPKKAFYTIPLLNEEYDFVKLGTNSCEKKRSEKAKEKRKDINI